MSGPRLVASRAALHEELGPARRAGARVALVPTMGALHAGHASLLRAGRTRAGSGPLVASVFVNPLQFAPGEDLDRYPRTLDADLAICAAEGVDLVLAPPVEELYPDGVGPGAPGATTVEPGPLAAELEGRTRPTHFRGVLTVVAKLLGLVRPDVLVLGEKDYQQLVLVRRMVRDLCLGVEVHGAGTVREPDGLALSSRNAYLDAVQRERATALHRTLLAASAAAPHGVPAVLDAARAELRSRPGGGPGVPRAARPRPPPAAARPGCGHPGAAADRGPRRSHAPDRQPARRPRGDVTRRHRRGRPEPRRGRTRPGSLAACPPPRCPPSPIGWPPRRPAGPRARTWSWWAAASPA